MFLILDWDGTVVDTTPIWIRTYQDLFREKSIKVSKAEIAKYVYGKEKGPTRFGITDYNSFNKEAFDKVAGIYHASIPFPYALETIAHFSQKNIPIAVLTSTPHRLVAKSIDFLNLGAHIKVLIGREDVQSLKPDPEGVLKAVKLLNGSINSTFLIGDSISDIKAGHLAGIKSFLFDPNSKVKISENTVIVKDWKEIKEIFKNI